MPRLTRFLITLCLGLFTLPLAAQQPTVVLQDVPPDVLIGEVFHFKVLFKAAPTTGYAPFVELAVQYQGADCTIPLPSGAPGPCDGLEIVGADALFANGSVPLGACSAVQGNGTTNPSCPVQQCLGTSPNPAPSGCWFGVTPAPAGHQKAVFPLPFGSFVPGQPDVIVDMAVRVHAFADPGQPLQILARGGFRYGNNPLGTSPATVGPVVSTSVTPHVFRVRKVYLGPENETATGPNFPRQYRIEVDVADGQTLQNVEVEDCFPANLKFLSASPPATTSGNCHTVALGTVAGGPGSVDASATYNFHVPELDSAGQPVLGPSCSATSLDQVTATGDWAIPADPRDSFVTDQVTASHTLADRCLAIQKTVSVAVDTGAPGPTPGDTLQYTLDFQLSDFRTVRDLVVDDYLSDGQTLLTTTQPTLTIRDRFGGLFSGSFVPGVTYTQAVVPSAPCQTADPTVQPQQIRFRVSPQLALLDPTNARHLLGILTGGYASQPVSATSAAGRIVFLVKIDDQYQRQPGTLEPFVDQNDPLLNCTIAAAQVLANANAPAVPSSVLYNTSDSSATEVRIVTGRLNKTVYAINGNTTVPAQPKVSPGDKVTFRIQYPFPSTDVENLKIVDYTPQPPLKFTTALIPDACNAASIPAVNHIVSMGPFCAVANPLPTTAVPASFTLSYPDFNDPTNTPRALDLRYTVQVQPDPFVDGLQLTNEAYQTEANTFGEALGQAAIAQVTLCEPKLRIRKGVVSTSKPGTVFLPSPPAPAGVAFAPPGSPAAFSGVIRSSNVQSALFSDVTGVDGCDRVRFAIVIENLGCSPKGAFDVKLRDILPAGLGPVANLQVRRGNGSVIPCTGCSLPALLGTGITLADTPGLGALAAYNPNSGANIAVITFDAQIGCQVAATGCRTNQAKLLNYAGVEGGPNHVTSNFSTPFPGASSPFSDEARVCVQPSLVKSIVSTSEPHTGNVGGAEQLAIGEMVTYQLEVTVPEGTSPNMSLTDTLPAGMKWLPGSCTLTKTPPVTTQSQAFLYNGASLTLNLGTVNNFANSPAPEKITVVCKALVLNDQTNNVKPAPKPNSFSVRIAPAGQAPVTFTSNTVPAVIVEPMGNLVKKDLGSPQPPAGIRSYQLTFANTGTSTAFDVTVLDLLPSPLTVSGPVLVSGGVSCTISTPPGQVQVTCASLPPGATLTIQFTVKGVPACGTVVNSARLSYSSLPGPKGTGGVTPGASGAPDGERVYSNSVSVTTDPTPCRLVAIAAGGVHSLALRGNGTVAAWGNNTAGQLGNGNTSNSGSAVNVSGLTSVKAISAGGAHSLALRSDGILWVWGRGDLGQLGNGANAHSSLPIQVPGLANVTAIAGGGYHSLAVTGGTVRAWGEGGSGQLGNGSTASSNVPVTVTGLTNIVAIAGGLYHSLAIRNDGTVWAWGSNGIGQLGNGTTTSSSVPVQVKGPGGVGFLTNIVAVSAGFNHSLALRSDGTVWAWGVNAYGQLGNGSNTNALTPVQATLTGVLSISAGGDFSLAVLSGGAVRAWGANHSGQVGVGSNLFGFNVPQAVSGLGVAQAVAGGGSHSLVLEDSGTAVHGWGFNSSGQVGDGTTTDRRSPVAVTVPCPHCLAPPSDMVAWWTFDETTGPTAADRAGSTQNNGTYQLTPVPGPGKVAGALCFDGANDRVEAPDDPELDVDTGDFSIDTWVKTTSNQGIITLIDKREFVPFVRGYTLFLSNGVPAFQMAIGAGSSTCSNSPIDGCTNFSVPGTPSIADGNWHHVAVTVDRDDPQGGLFYIDGQLVPGSFNPTLRPQSLGNGAVARIATHGQGGGTLNGCLDELEIFKRELTAAEIQALFAADSSGKCKC